MKVLSILVVLLTLIYFSLFRNPLPDIQRNVCERIRSKNYPCELLNTTTEDGFVIGIHHLSNPGGKPILLWHGMLQNAATWAMNFPSQDLIYLLHDAGFDVYLGNARGTIYSQKHNSLDPKNDSKEYWERCEFDYGSRYDLPAVIDYILENTGYQKLGYVGHSRGSTLMSVLLTEKPEYSYKVNLYVALSPPVFVANTKSPAIRLINQALKNLYVNDLFSLFGVHSLGIKNPVLIKMFTEVCKTTPIVCEFAVFMFAGWDFDNFNRTRIPIYISNPETIPIQDLNHGLQCVNKGLFGKYDFGSEKNIEIYGQATAPLYDLSKIPHDGTKWMIYYGGNDIMVVPEDVDTLVKELDPRVLYSKPIFLPKFSHLDFVWGTNANKFIYYDVVKAMLKQDFGKISK
ncbi:lipase [Anaeramoeba flamelloides]|uniref:Lipase n=1 Tax=Anaeramoeba flamelloides TaxID=1746091 RepID=A0ABQ8XXJ7_9EUKA|nr:lipase [Anaeramoeba flamelloides]